ncbi:MAG: replication-associated recombination protein A [Clostridia bacterium]
MYRPLADRLRPDTLNDVVGQQHILGAGGILRRIIASGNIPNMVFYGPSGTGKTTVANIIAKKTNRKLYKLNATSASISDIKAIIDELDTLMAPSGVLLYLDEIQYFNKKQQQSLLEFMENGKITLIASTTENPYFYVYPAVLSRATVFEFMPIENRDIERAIKRALDMQGEGVILEDGVLPLLASTAGGDVRRAINAVEMLTASARKKIITLKDAETVAQKGAMRYDRDGDAHYDIMSALQKSIRGSDPDAAVHYLARLLEAGDLPSACRRILVTASEDVGLAYPQAIAIVKACVDSARELGLPEARIPLAEAVILLATAPKSNSGICAIDAAMSDVKNGISGDIPPHLKDAHYKGAKKLGRGITYKYPHEYPAGWVKQTYLPKEIENTEYYTPGDNKFESANKKYWDEIKNK